MNDNWDKYLDPPDEPEAVFCDECGEEMEYNKWGDWMRHYMECRNPFCPGKHDGIAKRSPYPRPSWGMVVKSGVVWLLARLPVSSVRELK